MNMNITVHSLPECPKCEQLKNALMDRHLEYTRLIMTSAESLTELRINGVFALSAPVLQVGTTFFTVEDLFDGDTLKDLDQVEGLGLPLMDSPTED